MTSKPDIPRVLKLPIINRIKNPKLWLDKDYYIKYPFPASYKDMYDGKNRECAIAFKSFVENDVYRCKIALSRPQSNIAAWNSLVSDKVNVTTLDVDCSNLEHSKHSKYEDPPKNGLTDRNLLTFSTPDDEKLDIDTFMKPLLSNVDAFMKPLLSNITLINFGFAMRNHANVIIIDIRRKYVFLFEPHGKSILTKHPYLEFLCDLFDEYFANLGYGFDTNIFNQRWQKQEPFCQTWSLMFAELYVLNPNKKIEELEKLLHVEENDNYRITLLFTFLFYICPKIEKAPGVTAEGNVDASEELEQFKIYKESFKPLWAKYNL